MRRREFIWLIGGMAACRPLAARTQQSDRVRRIGILVTETVEDDPYYEGPLKAIRDGLRDLGWIEGQNLTINIHRVAPKAAEIRRHIEELLDGQPDIVVTSGGTATGPMLQATSSVPVVFMAVVDPVGAGLVESLARPGGNATGFMRFDYSLSGKWLEILKQVSLRLRAPASFGITQLPLASVNLRSSSRSPVRSGLTLFRSIRATMVSSKAGSPRSRALQMRGSSRPPARPCLRIVTSSSNWRPSIDCPRFTVIGSGWIVVV